MESYFHSVRMVSEDCRGCTTCIKHCPTEAIRVYRGKAKILDERCIDCGECMRVCPHHAKKAVTDSLSSVTDFDHSILLLAPSFYGQFPRAEYPWELLSRAFKKLGFSYIANVGYGAEHVTMALKEYMKTSTVMPLISSFCPVVVRLIQVDFPELIKHLVPLEAPMDVTAKLVKEHLQNQGIQGTFGTFFVTPCAAKVTATKQPLGQSYSFVDRVLGMNDVYSWVHRVLPGIKSDTSKGPLNVYPLSRLGVGWAKSHDRISSAQGVHLAIEGLDTISEFLGDMVLGKIPKIAYLDLHACRGGCVGGPLTIENPYIAKTYIHQISRELPTSSQISVEEFKRRYESQFYATKEPIEPRQVKSLDDDISRALAMIGQQELIAKRLPGLDCGACGSPRCQSLAEDVVRGWANEQDCVFLLRDSVSELASKLLKLANTLPPTLPHEKEPPSQLPKKEDFGKP